MRIRIINPFALDKSLVSHNCFGCSPNNEIGLQLTFYDTGEHIEAIWDATKNYEGFNNVLHGGMQATLQDEIAGWTVFTKCASSGVTKSLNIEYQKPVFLSNSPIRVTGKIIRKQDREVVISTRLYDSNNELCSLGEVCYVVFPEAVARRKYAYPGVEAFYE